MIDKINRIKSWQASIVLAVLGFATYFTGLKNAFQGDDYNQIVYSLPVHSLSHIKMLFEGGTFYNGAGIAPLTGVYYRPLMTTTYSLLYTLFGAKPFSFHFLQLLLCIASSILLFLVFRYTFNPTLSLVLALIFLVHPLNSQVVFAIPSMQDALFFFFGILSFWLLLRFHSVKSLVFVGACLFLSLLAKETAVCFIILDLLYLCWFERKRVLRYIGAIGLPVISWIILKILAVGLNPSSHNAPIDNLNLAGRLMTDPSILQFYLTKLIFPWKLATAYYWIHPTFSVTHVLLPLVIDVVVLSLVVWLSFFIRRKVSKYQYRTYLFFAAWAGVGLLTTLQIIPLDMTVCETWFYFSTAGVLGMAGVLVIVFQEYINPVAFLIVAISVVGTLGVRTAIRGTDFASDYKLALTDISASPQDYVAYTQASTYLFSKGQYDQSMSYASRAVSIFPTFSDYNQLGLSLAGTGDYARAQQAYYRGIRYGQLSSIYENLGALTLVYGEPTSNQEYLLMALQEFPHDSELWMYLAILDFRNNNVANARLAIKNAAEYGPINQQMYEDIFNGEPFQINDVDLGNRVIHID